MAGSVSSIWRPRQRAPSGGTNQLAGHAAQWGLMRREDADIDEYVTRKALDGLFLVIAEQERAIRRDPMGAATSIAKKVFGAVR